MDKKALWILLVAMIAIAPALFAGPDGMSGKWKLNEKESDSPREGGMGQGPAQGRGPGMRGGGGMGSGSRGGGMGPGMQRGSGGMGQRRGGRQGQGPAFADPITRIEQNGDSYTLHYARAETRTLKVGTDGTKLEDGKLVFELTSLRDHRLVETLHVEDGGKRLVQTIELPHRTIRRVYDAEK